MANHSSFAAEIEAMGAREGFDSSRRESLLNRIMGQKQRTSAYRACFLNEHGDLTPAAQIVLGDLSALAGIGKARAGRTGDELQFGEGQRHIVLHLFQVMRLDMTDLERMARKLRGNGGE